MKELQTPTPESPALFKAGELLLLESGEYSDKSWAGPFRVLKDFDIREAAGEVKAAYKPDYDGDEPGTTNLREWLFTNGFLEDVECRSIHIGSYGRIEIDL
jgi:hypothetical protein